MEMHILPECVNQVQAMSLSLSSSYIFRGISPSFEVPLFATFLNEDYQCPRHHLFKFMISCGEVMHNDNLLLRLFPLTLDGSQLD